MKRNTLKFIRIIFIFLFSFILLFFPVIIGKADNKLCSAKIKKQVLSKEYKNKEGKVIQTIFFEKPILQGDSFGIKKINQFYENLQKEILIPNNNTFLKIPSDYSITDKITYKITYNKNGILSILHSGIYYENNITYNSIYRISHTFDLNSGEELKLKDIFCLDEKQLSKKIVEVFKQQISKTKEEYHKDAIKTITQTAGWDSNFYLAEDTICFYYEPYVLAAFSYGYIEAKIPYKDFKLFKIKLQ